MLLIKIFYKYGSLYRKKTVITSLENKIRKLVLKNFSKSEYYFYKVYARSYKLFFSIQLFLNILNATLMSIIKKNI